MPLGKKMPQPGERLVHRFKHQGREVVAEIISVDKKTGKIAVRVGNTTYRSLSEAGQAVSGHSTNGWIFWGLKKQAPKQTEIGAN